MEKTRFLGLDGLRGVCALTVVLLHSELLFNSGVFFCHGYLAVDMFFILSGFVISASYDPRLAAGLTAWRFLLARVRRLAPVFWAGTLLCIAATVIRIHYEPAPANLALFSAMGLLLIPYLAPGIFAYPINPVAWTLLWELIVNFVYARWLRGRRSATLAALTVGLLLLASYASFHSYRAWSFGMTGSDLWLGGLRALPEFLTGVLLYRGHRAGLFARVPVISPILPLMAWLVMASLPQGFSPLVDLAIVALACPLLVVALVRAEAPRWFTPLGAISYPIYASHLAVVRLAQHTPLLGLNHGPRPLLAAGMVGLAGGIAFVLYRLFDPAARPKPLSLQGISAACEAEPKPV
ncbi:MAG TPA: acyltransferase [Rhizomicrobium sp.]|nr:acyltransferase [Rhizomicrobium sp.]